MPATVAIIAVGEGGHVKQGWALASSSCPSHEDISDPNLCNKASSCSESSDRIPLYWPCSARRYVGFRWGSAWRNATASLLCFTASAHHIENRNLFILQVQKSYRGIHSRGVAKTEYWQLISQWIRMVQIDPTPLPFSVSFSPWHIV